MAIIDELQRAKIGDAFFSWKVLTTVLGRSLVVNEYPNSPFRVVEDLDELPDIFTIKGSIEEPDYSTKKTAISNEFKRNKGPRRLVHPTFGAIDVVPGPVTIVEALNNVGQATLSMTFYRVEENRQSIPQVAETAASEISDLRTVIEDSSGQNVADTFDVSVGFPDNHADAQAKIIKIAAAISKAIKPLTKNETIFSRLTDQLEDFVINRLALINVPANLAASITALTQRSARLSDDFRQRLSLAQSLFGFGDDDSFINETTTQRIERQRNRDSLNGQLKTVYLAQAYDALVNIEFDTVDELDSEVAIIEGHYQVVTQFSQIDSATIESLADIRASSQTLLNEKRLTLQRISQIETSTLPMAIISYQYYGSADNTDKLIGLNDTRNAAFVEGSTKIFTAW